jgi:hypothetical protein
MSPHIKEMRESFVFEVFHRGMKEQKKHRAIQE